MHYESGIGKRLGGDIRQSDTLQRSRYNEQSDLD
jgi:hypothetical protein